MRYLETENKGLIERGPGYSPLWYVIPMTTLRIFRIFIGSHDVVVYNQAPDHLANLKRQQSKGTEASAQSVVKLARFGEPLHAIGLGLPCYKML